MEYPTLTNIPRGERAARVYELYISDPEMTCAELGRRVGLTTGQITNDLLVHRLKNGLTPQEQRASKRAAKKVVPDVPPSERESQPPAPPVGQTVSHSPASGSNTDELPVLARELGWPTFRFGVDEEPKIPIGLYTGQWNLAGDFIIVGDVHLPCTDWDLTRKMLRVARRHLAAPRQLLIAGDLLNMSAMSKFRRRVAPIPLRMELRAAEEFITAMLTVFDYIYAFMGNHETWLFDRLDGDLEVDQFARLITDARSRVSFSPYSEAYIESGGEQWYVPHQANYRQTKLSVANDMAAKKGCNVITTHQHFSAVSRDKGDRYTIIDCGGLFDQLLLEYHMLTPSTRPEMTRGFVLLKNGCATLLTPYKTMTDWSVWLPDDTPERNGAIQSGTIETEKGGVK